jgi:iduronate 2-sulfatase
MGSSIVTERYRLTRWVDRRSPADEIAVELYDLDASGEAQNLADDPRHAAARRALADRLAAGWRGEQRPRL